MRLTRTLTVAGLVLAVSACEQDSQGLPFDVDSATTRTVPAEGGVVSTPAGAAVAIPGGALSGPLTVTLAPTSVPGAVEGSAASTAFSIEPAGTLLDQAGEFEIKLSSSLASNQAWLTTLVHVSGGTVTESSGGDVDLGTGILTTSIDRFGTYLAVVPPASVVFPVSSGGPALSLSTLGGPGAFIGVTIDSLKAACGTPGKRCSGVQATASRNLLDLVEDAALLYPVVAGGLTINSTSVTGSVMARATLRVLLESLRTALSVEIHALLEPTALTVATQTATELHLTNMRVRVSGGPASGAAVEQTTDVSIPLTGSTGLVTVGRSFDIRVAGGATQPASVAFTFPVSVFE